MVSLQMKPLKISIKVSCCRCRRNWWVTKGVLLIANKKLSSEEVSNREDVLLLLLQHITTDYLH